MGKYHFVAVEFCSSAIRIQLNSLVIIYSFTQFSFGEFVQGKYNSKHFSELDYWPHISHEKSEQIIKVESHMCHSIF